MAELTDLVPARMRVGQQDNQRFDIRLSADGVEVEQVQYGNGTRFAEQLALEAMGDDSWEQLAELSADLSPRLFLARSDYLIIKTRLPRSVGAKTRSALALQLSTLSPIEPKYLDWNFVQTGEGDKNIDVALVIAKSQRLEEIDRLFADHGMLPPKICANLGDDNVILREPLQLHGANKKSTVASAIWLAALMIFAGLLITIGAAEWLSISHGAQVKQLQAQVAPKLKRLREARKEEEVRRAIAPVLNVEASSGTLEELAQILPESAYIVSASLEKDGSFVFLTDMADRKAVEGAFSSSQRFARFEAIQETEEENQRLSIEYRIARR